MENWIELKKEIGELEELEVWEASVHHEGKFITDTYIPTRFFRQKKQKNWR